MVDFNQALRLTLFEYHPSLLRRSVAASALGRYLLFNLPFGRIWVDARTRLADGPGTGQPPFAGNTSTDANVARVSKSLAVIDAFFRDLPNLVGLPPDRVLFTVDGMRYPDAAAAVWRNRFRCHARIPQQG